MRGKLNSQLFDFDIKLNHQIYVSKNELYNQLLLYLFNSTKNDVLLVYPTLNEATEVYNELKEYIENIYIFPEDEFITKSAVALSPELLYIRLKLLNNISSKNKKIVIVHYNSFIKKLPNKSKYKDNTINIALNDTIDRQKLLNSLVKNGYKRESLVTNTSEYAVRGFVIDIFPIHEEKPIRIELFDDQVEKIKYFNPFNQQSCDEEIDKISISPIKDDFGDNNSSLVEYLNNPMIVYNNYNEIKKIEKLIMPQVNYLKINNDLFKLSDLLSNDDYYINTIDNKGHYDIQFKSKALEYYNYDLEGFINDIIKNKGILYALDEKLINRAQSLNISIVKEYLNSGFSYNDLYYYSENDLYERKKETKITSGYTLGNKIDSLEKIQIGDYVVHKKSGIGVYMGLQTIEKNGLKKDYILIQYKGNDKLYLPVEDIERLYKYTSKEGAKPTIHKLNSVEWTKTKLRIKERIKSITGELIKLYKERSKATIEGFKKDDEEQVLFENEFNYEITPDQYKSSEEIKRDLEKKHPMERLLCGDVGYGKTEVIFRAMFKTIMNGKQCAYLCPTTILSMQQYNSAIKRYRNYGINIDLINRQFTNKQVQEKLKRLKAGKIDIIFGTHRLLSSDVVFSDLGLLVIDEEHRFGVEQKEKIKSLKNNVNVLSVSATPIPRSLQMSLVGIRDMSLIESAPKNRYPVQTYVIEYNDMLLREVVLKELSRNGQAFILYNNVSGMEKTCQKYKKLIPEAKICYAHGKMSKQEMQDIIMDFTNKKYDVLISTTIIENGIDIPNANTIIVLDSDRFGLSQLYQIRGRVGRSDRIAYAYFMYNKEKILSSIAIKRLEAIKEFTELGSGYKISMRDLSIRGAGDILGREQAGFIDSVGVDMYLDLINEEINGTTEEDESDVIPIEVETHIDKNYSDESSVIIDIHKKINGITNRKDLDAVLNEIVDRFGRTDEKILLYAHEKYYEKLLLISNVIVLEDDNKKILYKIKQDVYNGINIEKLFVETNRISTKFNFQYKNSNIIISLFKASLDKHYLYYSIELLELLCKLKNEV